MKALRMCIAIWTVLALGPDVLSGQQTLSGGAEAAGQAIRGVGDGELPPEISVPRLIRWSGVLKDLEGKPLAGPVDITFSTYKQQNDVEPIWQETQTVQADEQGHYTVLLGAMQTDGLPMEVFTSGEGRWLGVGVRGLHEQARVLLVSVPYAFKAEDAETLGGRPLSDFLLKSSSSTDATGGRASSTTATTPGPKAQSTTATPMASTTEMKLVMTAGGTIGYLPNWDSSNVITNSAIFQSGSNIGIGTTTPATAVDVNGTNAGLRLFGNGSHQVTVTGSYSSGRFGQDSVGPFVASDSKGKALRFLTNNGTPNEWMRITSNGNVGIGTTTPSDKLSVIGNVTASGNMSGGQLISTAASGTAPLVVNSTTQVPNLNASLLGGLPPSAFASLSAPNVFASDQAVPNLTASGKLTGGQLVSTVAGGTPPLVVNSPTQVPNLNASLLGGFPPSAFASLSSANTFAGDQTVANLLTTGKVTVGNSPAQNGEMAIVRDDLDTVHSVIGQAGSQLHFRLSRATPDASGGTSFLIAPYRYGMSVEYNGLIEFWSTGIGIHPHASSSGEGGHLMVENQDDSGGLFLTARHGSNSTTSYAQLTAQQYDLSSGGSMHFQLRDATDAFRFQWGPWNQPVTKAQISSGASATNLDVFSGGVQATLRADSGAGAVQFGASSNHRLDFFTNNGAPQATLFPSGNFAIGNSLDQGMLSVGSSGQFRVSSAGAVTIGGGAPITQHLSVTAALSFPAFAAQSCNEVAIAVPGAQDADTVALGISSALAALPGVTWSGWVSAPGQVSVRGCNATTTDTGIPPPATVRVDVWRH